MVPLAAFTHYETTTAPLTVNHQGAVPVRHDLVQSAAGTSRSGRPWTRSSGPQAEIRVPATHPRELPGHGAGVPGVARERADPDRRGAARRLHRARHPLREPHPPAHDPLDAAVGRASARCSRCSSTKNDLSVIALIGIILLIGIVKKNAILMIDFAIEAERKEGKSPEEAIFQACLLRFRPITMTTMAALLGGLPLAIGGRNGLGAAPARSASRSSAASSFPRC